MAKKRPDVRRQKYFFWVIRMKHLPEQDGLFLVTHSSVGSFIELQSYIRS